MINEFIEENIVKIRKICRYICKHDTLDFNDLENEAIATLLDRYNNKEINDNNLINHRSSVIYYSCKEAQRRLNMALREHSKRSKRPLIKVVQDEPLTAKFDRGESILSLVSDGIDHFDNVEVLTQRDALQKIKNFMLYVCPTRGKIRDCVNVYFDWLEDPERDQLNYVRTIFPSNVVSSFRTLIHNYKKEVIEQIRTNDISDCYNRYLIDEEYEIAIKTNKTEYDVINCFRIVLDLDLLHETRPVS